MVESTNNEEFTPEEVNISKFANFVTGRASKVDLVKEMFLPYP
jgi:hypothetical protein